MTAFVRSQPFDLVPFVQYHGMSPLQETWDLLGRDNICHLKWLSAHTLEHSRCKLTSEDIVVNGNRGCRSIMHTPEGQLTEIVHFDPVLNTRAIKEHFIKDLKDYKPFLAYLRDITVRHCPEPLSDAFKELGDNGLPHCFIGRSPYQQMWVEWVSIEDLALHMMDAPDVLEECFLLMHNQLVEIAKLIVNDPIPYYVIGDNITAPMIPPAYFEKYCMPTYQATADIMAEKNIPLTVHMDGDLKTLWDLIGKSPVRMLDSFSPPPDNDTSARQAVTMWPDKKLMLNFPSSVHLGSEKEIYNSTMEILNQAGRTGRLEIQISENPPPGRWKKSYPIILKAIQDFGNPFES